MQSDRTTLRSRGGREPERWLLLLFLFSITLINPWIRGDGVGYYAFARALLIEHHLDFRHDYQAANPGFREPRLDEHGQPKPIFVTSTGHLENHFSVGPAILWTPFLLLAHAGVLLARALGASIPSDGFSAPYRLSMALGTAIYGFLGLLLSYRLARQYAGDLWAFLATIGIWWGSSLPVYMYFNPSWSHAHSAFAVALFLWYWHETRGERTLPRWSLLAVIAGLMVNVYYANAMLLIVPLAAAWWPYPPAFRIARKPDGTSVYLPWTPPPLSRTLVRFFLFVAIVLVCLLPTFITRYIIYGNPLESGYTPLRYWLWRSPAFLAVLFSSEHGLFAWTPLLLFAAIGLVLLTSKDPRVGKPFLAAVVAFYLFIACYPDWAGISSYGNRFFISLTPLFIIGLSFFLVRAASLLRTQRAAVATASAVLACFVLWNAAFMFQWGTHLVPVRGPISWPQMIHNQFFVVPRQLSTQLRDYLFHRRDLMREIENRDIDQLKNQSSP